MTYSSRPYLLSNKIQHYAWGERGPSAFIPRLLGLQSVAADTPFAELWMGTHPLGSSAVMADDGGQIPLAELVARYPQQVLGPRVVAAFGNQFPFLLKVLSAGEPLSIQLHPSKTQAVALHRKDPEHYPDDNHKPEIAIALESLQALAGLRPPGEIQAFLAGFPALRDFIDFEAFAEQPERQLSRLAFLALLRGAVERPDELARVIPVLAGRLQQEQPRDYRERLLLELLPKYPGDVGLLSIFFLNLHMLEKGQALYLPAGVPHAYLKGNIVECMSSSDNVVRAGLTPKFKDIPALIDVATDGQPTLYSADRPSYVYDPPVGEFRVGRREQEPGTSFTDRSDAVRILLVLHGRLRLAWNGGTLEAAQGQSLLLPGSLKEVGIECLEKSELYIAAVP